MKRLSSLIALAVLSAPVLAEKVTPGNMPAYCRGQAASDFNTKPVYIKTGKLVKAKDGSYSIAGTYDGKDQFTCTYAKNGEFTGMTRGAAKTTGTSKDNNSHVGAENSGHSAGSSFGAGQIVTITGSASDAVDAIALLDGPGHGGTVGRVGNGRLMTVDNCEGNWCHVRTTTGQSTAGWIEKRHLRAR